MRLAFTIDSGCRLLHFHRDDYDSGVLYTTFPQRHPRRVPHRHMLCTRVRACELYLYIAANVELSSRLYGVVLYQAYGYFRVYSEDALWLKALVSQSCSSRHHPRSLDIQYFKVIAALYAYEVTGGETASLTMSLASSKRSSPGSTWTHGRSFLVLASVVKPPQR